MTRRTLLGLGAGLGVVALSGAGLRVAEVVGRSKATPLPSLDGLRALAGGHPRAWFFRQAEAVRKYSDYDGWADQYRCLDGIQGKVFAEEIEQLEDKAQEWFTRFKQENPDQLVLLHFNGKGRRPEFGPDTLFPGHWLYYAGTTVESAATVGETTLRVRDTDAFRTDRLDTPDDVVIVPPGDDGWRRAEHARLVSKDEGSGTITVRRGQYGSKAVAVPAGSYVAAHVRHRPPRIPKSMSLWMYNFASDGPRDAAGRTCGQALASELGGHLGAGGALQHFDGVQFDVLFFVPDGRSAHAEFVVDQQLVDVDNDGEADGGFVSGRNVYGDGVNGFCADLRRRLPAKLILADGMMPEVLQRSFGTLNGMESEGFPIHRDPDFDGWSDGLNRHEFWRTRGMRPALNYLVFKYVKDQNKPGKDPAAYRRLRLALAAAVFTDSAFVQGERWAPPKVRWRAGKVSVRVFDELWLGAEQRPHWLGRATDAATHLAVSSRDLLAGEGADVDWSDARPDGEAGDTGEPLRVLDVGSVDVEGDDLLVAARLMAEPLGRYPDNARRVAVRATPADGRARQVLAWADADEATSTYAFRDVGRGKVRLELVVEGEEPVTVSRLTAHDHADAMYRTFEHGVVLANPSNRPFTFELAKLVPGKAYRRIQGTRRQDRKANDGSRVGDRVTVGALDGLFLREV